MSNINTLHEANQSNEQPKSYELKKRRQIENSPFWENEYVDIDRKVLSLGNYKIGDLMGETAEEYLETHKWEVICQIIYITLERLSELEQIKSEIPQG